MAEENQTSKFDRRAPSGRVHPLVRRLVVGIKWQWRWAVIKRESLDYIDGVGDVFCHVFTAVVGSAMILIWPVFIVWRFTGGMIWTSLTADQSSIDKLAAKISPNKAL